MHACVQCSAVFPYPRLIAGDRVVAGRSCQHLQLEDAPYISKLRACDDAPHRAPVPPRKFCLWVLRAHELREKIAVRVPQLAGTKPVVRHVIGLRGDHDRRAGQEQEPGE